MREKLKSWGLELAPNLVEFPGRILPTEKIVVNKGQTCSAGANANWDQMFKTMPMLLSVNVTKWVVIFESKIFQDVKKFCEILQRVAKNMGYIISMPTP